MRAAQILLIAAAVSSPQAVGAQVRVPPEQPYKSGSFACAMSAPAGEAFSLNGSFGNWRLNEDGSSNVDFRINAPEQNGLSGFYPGSLRRGAEMYYGFDDAAGTTTLATIHALSAGDHGALMIQLRSRTAGAISYDYFVGHCTFELSYADQEIAA